MFNSEISSNIINATSSSSLEKKVTLSKICVALFAAASISPALAELNTICPKANSEALTSSFNYTWSNGTNDLCWNNSIDQENETTSVHSIIAYQQTTLFDFDKSVLKTDAKSKLNDLLEKIKTLNIKSFLITGHTDRIGTDIYNQDLAYRRAITVKHYLVSKGWNPEKIFVTSQGKQNPITHGCIQSNVGKASKDTAYIDCLSMDRRVTIEALVEETK